MKSKFAVSAAAAVILSIGLCPVAFADSANIANTKPIVVDGTTVPVSNEIVYKGTVYMPVSSIMDTLTQVGIHSTWDGSNLRLETPSALTVHLDHLHVGSGDVAIYLNGTLVQRIASYVVTDQVTKNNISYLPIWYVSKVLERAGITAEWGSDGWQILSPQAQILKQALYNTATADTLQMSGSMSIHVHLGWAATSSDSTSSTSSTSSDSTSTSSSIPTDLGISFHINDQKGYIQGQHAELVNISQLQITGLDELMGSQNQIPSSIEEYIQGPDDYMNTGTGWQLMSTSGDNQDIGSSVMNNPYDFSILNGIQAQQTSTGYIFTGSLNGEDNIKGLSQDLAGTAADQSSNGTGNDANATIDQILKYINSTFTINVQSVSGKYFLTGEQANVSADVPQNALSTSSTTSQSSDSSSDFTLSEKLDMSVTFNQTPIVRPTGLPTTLTAN